MGAAIWLTTGILNGPPQPQTAPERWRVFLLDSLSGRGAREFAAGLYDRDRDGPLHGVDVWMPRTTPSATDTWETLTKFELPWPAYVLQDDRVDLILFAKGGDGAGSNESRLRISVTDGTGTVTGPETVLQVAESRTEVQAIVDFAPVAGANMTVTLEAFDNSASSNRLEARCTDRGRALQFTVRTQAPS